MSLRTSIRDNLKVLYCLPFRVLQEVSALSIREIVGCGIPASEKI